MKKGCSGGLEQNIIIFSITGYYVLNAIVK